MQGLASKPRAAGTAAEGTFVPFAEVDIRTSIRPTVAEIDLGAVQRNLSRFRRLVGPSVAVFGVVKADAYGHGAVPVARALEPLCNALAVSLVEEGLELRAAGIRAPIFVLGAYYNRHQDDVIGERLTPVVYDLGDLERFGAAAARRGRRIDVHVKVDTGMSRLGIAVDQLPGVLARLDELPALRLAGLCTHLASADLPDAGVTEAGSRPVRRLHASRRGARASPTWRTTPPTAPPPFASRARGWRRCVRGWRCSARCRPVTSPLPELEAGVAAVDAHHGDSRRSRPGRR